MNCRPWPDWYQIAHTAEARGWLRKPKEMRIPMPTSIHLCFAGDDDATSVVVPFATAPAHVSIVGYLR
jgi:hypothetical protein